MARKSAHEGRNTRPTSTASSFDTLAATRALEAAGIERKQAEAHAEQLRAAAGADLDQLATRLEGSHALLKWMVGFTLAFVVAIAWRVFV